MEVVIFFLASSLLWVIGYPVIAYSYAKKLKKEHHCPNGIFAFAIFTALPIFATPFIAYLILMSVWFRKILIAIPLLLYPFCIVYGLSLFYKSILQNRIDKAKWCLIATWGVLLLLALSFHLLFES
ncbi:MAG: hypothetical protein NC241_02350 [Bacteroides sp.]|nr:hypothetical protein [Bacteroides sp.]MCM1457412.1 hypothetical protein [Lachnoclostridium sp.]